LNSTTLPAISKSLAGKAQSNELKSLRLAAKQLSMGAQLEALAGKEPRINAKSKRLARKAAFASAAQSLPWPQGNLVGGRCLAPCRQGNLLIG
jgi:hypothetical protein